ncbi:MAG: plasmid stabilization system protein [Ignavibacteria bacterium]|nr:MAG: plasmid stabilization system protein [Ignavibacteria bacterium]
MKIFWTKEALLRLQDIEEYISRDNPIVAIEFIDKLISLAETLIDNPEKGRIVPELSLENIRELLHKNYRIVYLVKLGKPACGRQVCHTGRQARPTRWRTSPPATGRH